MNSLETPSRSPHSLPGQVIKDLDFPQSLSPIVLSEEERVEKPAPAIFLRALELVNCEEISLGHSPIEPDQCLHIGDDILWFVQVAYSDTFQVNFPSVIIRERFVLGCRQY